MRAAHEREVEGLRRWRVAVTRDEDPQGPLSRALRDEGFEPWLCPVAEELPPDDVAPLAEAAGRLEGFDWVILSSVRAVAALAAARSRGWPRRVRTAAVGHRTAAALVAAGADPPPVTAEESGADALWAALQDVDTWPGRRVLVPAVAGGRRTVIDGLRSAGALVTVVEAYRMRPRAPGCIASDWRAIAPDAAVIASPSAAGALVDALGREVLMSLRAVVVIGRTTEAALRARGVLASRPPHADFVEVARHLSRLRAVAAPS